MNNRLFVLIAAASLAACSALPGAPVVTGTPPPAAVSSSPPAVPASSEQAAVHELSLPAMFSKTYDGRDLKLGKVLADNTAYTRYYLTYKSGDLTISGIMNIPKGEGPFPVVIMNHGYIDPAVYTNGRGLKREQDYLARHGYAVLHTDYRNHAESDDEADYEMNLRFGYVEDSINAVEALRKANLPSVDAERVGMLGHSMGGGVTINAMVIRPDLIDAAVLYAPVHADPRRNVERWTMRGRAELAKRIFETYGTFEESPEFWENLVAATFFDRIRAPVQVYHGTKDASVPFVWSQDLLASLTAAGKPVELIDYEGEAHEFGPKWTSFMEGVDAFFTAEL